jgi:hypothetical protein
MEDRLATAAAGLVGSSAARAPIVNMIQAIDAANLVFMICVLVWVNYRFHPKASRDGRRVLIPF